MFLDNCCPIIGRKSLPLTNHQISAQQETSHCQYEVTTSLTSKLIKRLSSTNVTSFLTLTSRSFWGSILSNNTNCGTAPKTNLSHGKANLIGARPFKSLQRNNCSTTLRSLLKSHNPHRGRLLARGGQPLHSQCRQQPSSSHHRRPVFSAA
jgi:hypothetical protein